jgi:hypothetical protein
MWAFAGGNTTKRYMRGQKINYRANYFQYYPYYHQKDILF